MKPSERIGLALVNAREEDPTRDDIDDAQLEKLMIWKILDELYGRLVELDSRKLIEK